MATPTQDQIVRSVMTLAIGALGAGLGRFIGLPMFMVTGPFLLVAVAGYAGMPVMVAEVLRSIIFVMIGVALGAGLEFQASVVFSAWPLALLVLAATLVLLTLCNTLLLRSAFGFSRSAAVLAAAPGHLVSSGGRAEIEQAERARIKTVHSIRFVSMALALIVVAALLGADVGLDDLRPVLAMGMISFVLLLMGGVIIAVGLSRLRIPAALVVSGMLAAILAGQTGLVKGAASGDVLLGILIAVGTLLGCRTSSLRPAQLRTGGLAGLATALVGIAFALLGAYAAAGLTGVAVIDLMAAFLPGMAEMMILIGAALGANAGLLAASHVLRILILTVFVRVTLRDGQHKQGNPGAAE